MAEPMLDAALEWHRAGFSVIRVSLDGSKAPLGQWKPYTQQRATEQQLHDWFNGGHPGLGVVCGAISGNLEMLEFEGRAIDDGTYGRFQHGIADVDMTDVWSSIARGYMELSPGGGLHFLYRVAGTVDGNTKLASTETSDTLIETRGEGGQVVVWPSHGPTHPTGKPWTKANTCSPATVVTISADQRDLIHIAARGLNRKPAPPPLPDSFTASLAAGELHPGEDYNQRADWADILVPHGWSLVRQMGAQRYWRRPGKKHGPSAVTGSQDGSGRDYLYVWSTSTELPDNESMSKWRVYAMLEHGGDFSGAAGELRQLGYGTPLPERPRIADVGLFDRQPSTQQPDMDLPQPELTGRFSPYLFDREQLAQLPKPEPLIEDTLDMGTVSLIAGSYGTLKSFVVQDWAACLASGKSLWQGRTIKTHGRVLYIASEGAHGLNQRLTAWEQFYRYQISADNFVTLNAKPNLGRVPDIAELYEIIGTGGYKIVVIDTLAKCMSGLDENSAKDMGIVIESLYKLRDATGDGIVIPVHHTGKSKTIRGSSALESGVDTVYMTDGSASGIELKRTKRKDGETADLVKLRLDIHGEDAVLILNSESSLLGLTDNAISLYNILVNLFGDDGVSMSEFGKVAEESGFKKSTFYDAVQSLVRNSFAEKVDMGGSRYRIKPFRVVPKLEQEG